MGISSDGKVQTLTSRMGTGGGNVPLLMDPISVDARHADDVVRISEKVPTLEARDYKGGQYVLTPKTLRMRSGCEGGGKGPLIQNDKSGTITCNNDQVAFIPKTYGICSKDSNAMKSDNPNSGFYEATTSRTIDCKGGNPTCNQGGMGIVEQQAIPIEGNGQRPSHKGNGWNESDKMFTLNTTEQHAVAYGIDRAAFNQGKNAQFGITIEEEVEPTIVAKDPGAVAQPKTYAMQAFGEYKESDTASTLKERDYKDSTDLIEIDYIVRRLTPMECARLQGFDDDWTDGTVDENPDKQSLAFWIQVWLEHWAIIGRGKGIKKPKTEKEVKRWLASEPSDSDKYKLWGNGIALPCAFYVFEGIKKVLDGESAI